MTDYNNSRGPNDPDYTLWSVVAIAIIVAIGALAYSLGMPTTVASNEDRASITAPAPATTPAPTPGQPVPAPSPFRPSGG